MAGPQCVCLCFMECVLSRSTLLRLQVALPGTCLRRALGCIHFLDLHHSGSGSRVPHKGTDSVGPGFCALPRSEQPGRASGWRAHSSQLGSASYHLPCPSHSVSWVHSGRAMSGVLCVPSGAPISVCDSPDGCQLSRIPRRLG